MKKIEIIIIENNLADDMIDTKEFKCVTVCHIVDENAIPLDNVLEDLLQKEWLKIKEYFLKNRSIIPFTPLKYPLAGYIPSSILAIAELEKLKDFYITQGFSSQVIEDYIDERIKKLKEK